MARQPLPKRLLGRTSIALSPIAFGAGPVPALLTREGSHAAQLPTIARALEAGINWFDTAATYGEGRSETHLGAALRALGAVQSVHVATKVRLEACDLDDIQGAITRSLRGSLARLGLPRVTLLQLHNSITTRRGDQPTSITPRDVLEHVVPAMECLRRDGVVGEMGLTALGELPSLSQVLRGARWATAQVCCNLLDVPAPLLSLCAQTGTAVLAIRVLAGGALAGQPPSDHTRTTRFFPLHRYEQDARLSERLATLLPAGMSLPEAAIRAVTGRTDVASAIIGFASPEQVDEAVRFAAEGPLPPGLLELLQQSAASPQPLTP